METPLQRIFIANLKKFRRQQGLSQMTLSQKCGTTANYIGQIEMGRRIPSFEKIEKIAAALEIASHELFMCEGGPEKRAEQKLQAKDFLKKMPANVKKEIAARFLSAVKKDIVGSFDPGSY